MAIRSVSRVAIVTQVSDPIRSAVALRLARQGAHVIACDINPQEIQAVIAAGVDEFPIMGFAADLAEIDEAERLVAFALERYQRIDVLINSAGPQRTIVLPLSRNELLTVGITGLRPWVNCIEAVAPVLESSSGRIVSIVRHVGRYRSGYFRPEGGTLSATAEALTDGAILSLTRQLAFEYAPKRIRVNAVVVGLIEGSEEFDRMSDRERQYVLQEISLGRLGTPEEVASVVTFLSSKASNYITGDAIDVNGGWWMS